MNKRTKKSHPVAEEEIRLREQCGELGIDYMDANFFKKMIESKQQKNNALKS